MISIDRYAILGGAKEIILKHFEQAMSRFSLREQSLAFEMFRYLVTERGTKMAYRADDLASDQLLGAPVNELQPILAYLASKEARILRADQRLDQTWYELYHDVFAQIIRTWSEEFQADENRRMYRQITNAARKWANTGRDESLLLSGAALLQIKDWQKRNRADTLAPEEHSFLRQSLAKYSRWLWMWRGIVAVITMFAIIAAGFGLYANKQRNAADQQFKLARIRSLIAYAYDDNSQKRRERAALLVRQASLLNQQYHGNMQDEIDIALRTIFHTAFITKSPYNSALVEQVCQKVKLKTVLTDAEWNQFIGDALGDKSDCPKLQQTYPLQLRSEPMRTIDYMPLSLNVADAGGFGMLADDVPNQFKPGDKVIFDETTGLLSENSDLPQKFTHANAEGYCANLRLAEKDGWRLPTVEELLSLMEQTKNTTGKYIHSQFAHAQDWIWIWSADLKQAKGESSAGAAWDVRFDTGSVSWHYVGNQGTVLCVRSGQ